VAANQKDKVLVEDPKSYEEREKVAGECVRALGVTIPALIDTMDDTVEKLYAGWPDRMYVIDKSGKIVYKGLPGPRGFKPAEAEQALKKLFE
jgi:hypothetical protein